MVRRAEKNHGHYALRGQPLRYDYCFGAPIDHILPVVVPDIGVLCHRGHFCHCIYPSTGVNLPGCVRLGSYSKTPLAQVPLLALHALRVYTLSERNKVLSVVTFALSLADFILQLVSPISSHACND